MINYIEYYIINSNMNFIKENHEISTVQYSDQFKWLQWTQWY